MRTTLTLDDDVAAKLRAEVRRTGRSFREVVNDHLRLGLLHRRPERPREPFRIHARDLGALRPGLTLDDVSGLIESIEDPGHR